MRGVYHVTTEAGEYDTYKVTCTSSYWTRIYYISPELTAAVYFKRTHNRDKKPARRVQLIREEDHNVVLVTTVGGNLAKWTPETQMFPGETRASAAAQLKTSQLLMARDTQADPGCQVRKIVDRKIIKTDVEPEFTGDCIMKGTWTEHWYVDRCGRSIPYTVSYKADGRGGTEIRRE